MKSLRSLLFWLFRLIWNRRVAWTLITLASLLTVYYQWENRRSARELVEARAQFIARIGTDDPRALMPPPIADAENYFALPIIESWRKDDHTHEIPEHVFWPENLPKPALIENEAEGTARLDFTQWTSNRDLKGQTPAQALNGELRVTDGLLTQLAVGLDRPFSCLKPAMLTAIENAEGDLFEMNIPSITGLMDRHRELALYLCVSARAGDSAKAQTTARILLRLFPEASASHGTLVSMLVSIATHEVAFEALQDALAQPVWDERGLTLLQAQLAKDNDLVVMRRAFAREALWGHSQLMRHRENAANWQFSRLMEMLLQEPNWSAMRLVLGPIGWQDADSAQHLIYWAEIIGPETDDAWLSAASITARIGQEIREDLYIVQDIVPNPRRFIGSALMPNLGAIHAAAAETLFRRRCLILACELEKHRIKHDAYPATLPVLSGFETHDPASPEHALGYKLEATGYVLTSAQGWQWRMKRTL